MRAFPPVSDEIREKSLCKTIKFQKCFLTDIGIGFLGTKKRYLLCTFFYSYSDFS